MTGSDFLLWVRGPAFEAATVIFVFGVLVRLIEILALGKKTDLAVAKGNAKSAGLRTIFTRSLPRQDTWKRSAFGIAAGYVFHVGLFVVILFFAPHILVFREVLGIGWPALPTPVVDAFAVITIVALVAVLVRRVRDPVLRLLSGVQDYLVWTITCLPVVTGYLAFHRLWLPYPTMLGVHILSVELLMVVFPFTKLMHTFTLFLARYYNGATAGYRGVRS